MNQAQGLILTMYAGFFAVVLLAGYLYKEASIRKERGVPSEVPLQSESRVRGIDDGSEPKKLISQER